MQEIDNQDVINNFITTSGYDGQFSFDPQQDTKLFHIAANDFIVKAGAPLTYLFYLVKGKAKLYDVLANGKVSLIDFFTPPCFIGEMELIEQRPEIAFSMQAITDCWCLALPIRPLQKKLLADPIFLRQICLYFVHKNYRTVKTAGNNAAFPVAQRLASFILLTAHDGLYSEKHVQVAEFLGISYRHLLYVLAQFVKDGYLVKQQHHYKITNLDALTALAQDVNESTN
ncbi:N-ribosylNicotinamide CRP-like regulator [Furfurilactobacillus rossiae]|uniref:transcriptional regulator YeiL n=1 Tax=Furfurilactobacillus rossiae TaxID=231049 RepID=UPI0015B7ECC5|nr:transcriptional regulator YeiL [Furfurilactobacillus rossiae]MCF6165570.1 transcriptional regulator YeiL [Furfurilactobacillus rossiae]QLE63384.1 N-ribosylNicotinamide CRP-like regulator [Furfurilactobacillus rossiae]